MQPVNDQWCVIMLDECPRPEGGTVCISAYGVCTTPQYCNHGYIWSNGSVHMQENQLYVQQNKISLVFET